jgi:hypothetical protein
MRVVGSCCVPHLSIRVVWLLGVLYSQQKLGAAGCVGGCVGWGVCQPGCACKSSCMVEQDKCLVTM